MSTVGRIEALLGLDISSRRTGWAILIDGGANQWRCECGSWAVEGEDFAEKSRFIGTRLVQTYKQYQSMGITITRAGIEAPLVVKAPRVKQKRGDMFATIGVPEFQQAFDPIVMTNQTAMNGAAHAVLACMKVDTRTVRAATWRKAFIGIGQAPKGTKNSSAYLKKLSRDKAIDVGIQVKNVDEGDAVGIVFWLRQDVRHIPTMRLRGL